MKLLRCPSDTQTSKIEIVRINEFSRERLATMLRVGNLHCTFGRGAIIQHHVQLVHQATRNVIGADDEFADHATDDVFSDV